ncbi:MAG: hypothetical protein WCO52_01320 [bacterium]
MAILEEFQAILMNINRLPEPKDIDDLTEQMALVSQAIEKCEKLLLYLITSQEGRDEMVTHFFEYKQLLRLEQTLHKLKQPLLLERYHQEQKAVAKNKRWWQW